MTKTGELLGLSQPSVSRLLRELEDHLGFALFRREGRHLVPTLSARLLHDEAATYLDQAARIERIAQEIRWTRNADLNVAANPALASGVVLSAFKAVEKERPQPTLSVSIVNSREIHDWVASGKARIGLGFGLGKYPGVVTVAELKVACVAILPPGHPLCAVDVLTPEQIAAYPVIAAGLEDECRAAWGNDRYDRALGHARVSTPTAFLACDCVCAGLGVAVIDPFTAHVRDGKGLEVRKVLPAVAYPAYIAHTGLDRLERHEAAFVAECRNVIAATFEVL